jgi:hypothetical protein
MHVSFPKYFKLHEIINNSDRQSKWDPRYGQDQFVVFPLFSSVFGTFDVLTCENPLFVEYF